MTFLAQLLRAKSFVWTLLVLPGLWPLWPIFIRPEPTILADPLKYVLHHFGFVACLLLALVLSFSPLRVLAPKSPLVQALNRHRRLVGVGSFAYAALHFLTHLTYEGGASVAEIVRAIPATLRSDVKKPFLLTGLIAFTILSVLAVTSLHRLVRWLGGRRWKNLHRSVYLAAALVAYHQAAARKIFPVQVLWIFVPLAVLEILRIWKLRSQRPAAAPG